MGPCTLAAFCSKAPPMRHRYAFRLQVCRLDFVHGPTGISWYRSSNASVHTSETLTGPELPAFMMRVGADPL